MTIDDSNRLRAFMATWLARAKIYRTASGSREFNNGRAVVAEMMCEELFSLVELLKMRTTFRCDKRDIDGGATELWKHKLPPRLKGQA